MSNCLVRQTPVCAGCCCTVISTLTCKNANMIFLARVKWSTGARVTGTNWITDYSWHFLTQVLFGVISYASSINLNNTKAKLTLHLAEWTSRQHVDSRGDYSWEEPWGGGKVSVNVHRTHFFCFVVLYRTVRQYPLVVTTASVNFNAYP